MNELISKLLENEDISLSEWEMLISDESSDELLFSLSREKREAVYGRSVFLRGLVEFTSFCSNDCRYCGLRRSNRNAERYRLREDEILQTIEKGHEIGFRSFVLQGGEDPYFTTERMYRILKDIKNTFPDSALTLSIGELSEDSYRSLKEAGADRYLLRHETADSEHYRVLHPEPMSLENRMNCLYTLKKLGYQTGAGMMVGSPGSSFRTLAEDMIFMGEFRPHMIGIGPFIPHSQTPFKDFPAGSVETTLMMLSLCRIMIPEVLLPATTALGTVRGDGRQEGVLAGCNVIMPNLSPLSVRKKYMLYDNKVGTADSAADGMARLAAQMEAIGYQAVSGRGDSPRMLTKQPV